MSSPRLLIADDHAPTRAGVRRVLEENGFEVCAEAATAADALRAAVREQPDICVLDIRMPGDGIAAAGAIARRLPETAVVMLTVSSDDDDLFEALRAGACGYLLKDMDRRRLPQALNGVLAGEAALPRHLVARVVDEFRGRSRRRRLRFAAAPPAELTVREWDVLELLREGLSTNEIAQRLFVAPVTVRTHVRAILKKLQAPDRESALRRLERASLER